MKLAHRGKISHLRGGKETLQIEFLGFQSAREGIVGSQEEPGRQVCRQPSEQAVSVKVSTARLAEASQWPT